MIEMISNPVIDCLLGHRSIRKYTDDDPTNEVLETVVRAGQQAPFASQTYSILLSRDRKKNPWNAPLLFTICIDAHKFEAIMKERDWTFRMNDLSFMFLSIQDASLAAENMIIAGRSLRMGSCLLGAASSRAVKIAEEYDLPERVFPLVQLTMGYPDENPPTRPRYPLNYTLFEDKYEFTRKDVLEAMRIMDEGYLAQDYYKKANAKIPITVGKEDKYTFDDYSWTEHICRKLGQWSPDPAGLTEQLLKRGFNLSRKNP
ncbi:MAG: nitroreductase family protein [Candidatus Bathyarchaeota archaeon]|nr:nitroreductase family protein [Candidatus Bathyarchaeota archaeon]